MKSSKNIVVVMKGGFVSEVYSNDENISLTFIDVDVKKDCEGMTNQEVQKLITSETEGLKKVLKDFS